MGFGGEFRKIRQEKKMEAIEAVDLVTLREVSSDSEGIENLDAGGDERFKCNHKTADGVCGFDLRTNKKRYNWDHLKRDFFLKWSEEDGFIDSG
jgi:hypothetical protein